MSGVRARRYLVILAVVAGIVGLYAAAGFLLIPHWIRSELVGLTARDYGRTLAIGDVRFNPFTWTLEVTDVSFPDADGRPMIAFGRLEVALGISTVTHLAPSLREIVLDNPRVRAVIRRDGTLNFADLAKPFRTGRPAAANRKPFTIFIGRLAVENGSASYEDDSRATPFQLDLDPIAFELLGFGTSGSTPGSYHLTAVIGQGGRLDWQGTVSAAPLSLHGTLQLDGLTARTVAQYLGAALPAQISRGTIALQGGFAIDSQPGGAGVRMSIDVPRAQVTGLGLRPRRGNADYVQLGRFTLGDAHIDLARHAIRVGEMTLAGGDVHAWLDPAGRLNLLELLGDSAGKPPSAAGASRSMPAGAARRGRAHAPLWRIGIADVRVEDTRVSVEDRGVKPSANLTLGPLSARITGYDSAPGSRITVSLRSAVNGKGELRLAGGGTLQPQALSAKVELGDIDLRALQPYLGKYTALRLNSGLLSTTLEVDRHAGGPLSVSGRIEVDRLRTVDDALKLDFVKWQALHVVGLRYLSSPASLRIERIIAVAPYARVIIEPDHTINVSEALHPRGYRAKAVAAQAVAAKTAPAAAAPTSGSRSAQASMPMSIGLVRIASGTADYADLSIQPNFATGIQDLHGAVKGLSSDPSSRASVDLKGTVNGHAPVEISGVVNLLAASVYSDIRMKFRGLELTQMTPYAVRFAGYKIASGTLDADLHYKVDHGRLSADHQLVIDQLQLGEQVESPHAVKLPLRLAIALLKDRDGVIRIGLPVSGSLDNPQFSLGPLIGKALLNVLKKAVTAPFSMLGRLFGGGPDVNRIDFAPGSAELAPQARARLAALAKALAQRPQLQLQVPAVFAPDIDRPALARTQLREELLALARTGAAAPPGGRRGARRSLGAPVGQEVLELPAAHFRLLRVAYQRTFGPKKPLPAVAQKVPPFEPAILQLESALLERMQVSDADLQALAQHRALAIRAALLSAQGVAAGRVVITSAAPQSAPAGQVAVKLGLK
jgi:Domain of Unknown Function (DUF748)